MTRQFEFSFTVDEELMAVVPAARAAGKVTAVIHETESDEEGYWAEIPAMPGCVSEGDTLEEMKANIREAAEGWLEVTRDKRAAEKTSRKPGDKRTAAAPSV